MCQNIIMNETRNRLTIVLQITFLMLHLRLPWAHVLKLTTITLPLIFIFENFLCEKI